MILREFEDDATVSELWETARASGVSTFDLYVSGLDLLFLFGLLDHVDGRLTQR